MTWLAFVVVAFVAYQFGRWAAQSDSTMENYSDRNEINRLTARVRELENEIQQHEVEERTVVWQ